MYFSAPHNVYNWPSIFHYPLSIHVKVKIPFLYFQTHIIDNTHQDNIIYKLWWGLLVLSQSDPVVKQHCVPLNPVVRLLIWS